MPYERIHHKSSIPLFFHRARTFGFSATGWKLAKQEPVPGFSVDSFTGSPNSQGDKKRFDVIDWMYPTTGCYVYLEPVCPLFLGLQPSKKKALSDHKIGSFWVLGRCVESNQPRTLVFEGWILMEL